MRILICTPYGIDEPRGNSVATGRLRDGFTGHGHEVLVLDHCERADRATTAAAARLFDPQVGLVMHGWRCAGSFQAVRSVSDAPLVVSLRGTDLNEMMKDLKRRATMLEVLDRCGGITVLTPEAKGRLAEARPSLAHKVEVIPNGISLPGAGQAQSAGLPWILPEGAIVFAGVAGIRGVKRPSWVVEGLRGLRGRGLDIRYVHAGPVLEKAEGERFLRVCREEPWVYYAGAVAHEQVPALLRRAHVFVSASRSEGMPHSVREAMLVGLPCLLSDIEGHRTLGRPGMEALFFRDRKDFMGKAVLLAGDPALRKRLGKMARTRAERRSGNGREIEGYLRFFARLVKGAGGATGRAVESRDTSAGVGPGEGRKRKVMP